MSNNYDEYFKDENKIETNIVNDGKYKLIIHKYDTKKLSGKNTWNYTQGILYEGDRYIGSIKRNYSHLPYYIFKKQNKDYFISGSSYMTQTIIDCQTGEVFENKNSSGWIWATYHPIDDQTLCVCGCYWGGPYHYQFFDMSYPSKGWPQLEIDPEVPNYDYILLNNNLAYQTNYSGPIIEDDKVIFNIREERIKDEDLDLEWYEFKYQDRKNIKSRDDYKDKLYFAPMSKLILKRQDKTMKLIEFWRSDEQIRRDNEDQSD